MSKSKRNKFCKKKAKKNGKQKVKTFCPEACGACETECPTDFSTSNGKKKKCSKYQSGSTCASNYKYTGGCGADDPINCVAINTYTCGSNNKWNLSTLDVAGCLTDSGLGPLFPSGETCDPAECPLAWPEEGTDCKLAQDNDCVYDYQYVGCTFNSIFCEPAKFASCNEENKWETSYMAFDPCQGLEAGLPYGGSCEPCSEVKPEDTICPSDIPTNGELCDIDIRCDYYFMLTGCSTLDLKCTPSSMFSCVDGVWEETASIPEICTPPPSLPCPDWKPEYNAACTQDNGFEVGLVCNYDYRNTSCEEGKEVCSSLETYECSESGWIGLARDYFCEEPAPEDFLKECDPVVIEPKS